MLNSTRLLGSTAWQQRALLFRRLRSSSSVLSETLTEDEVVKDHKKIVADVYPPIRSSDGDAAAAYRAAYARSIADPEGFWSEQATAQVTWFSPFSAAQRLWPSGDGRATLPSEVSWFPDGKLNVAYNCVDRHLATRAGQTAILWEGDDGQVRSLTYAELFVEVGRLTNALRSLGVRKGDVVAIYMPMVPEAAVAMLACARLGAMHTVIFAGFSAEAVRERVLNCRARVVITADEAFRAGRVVPLKRTMDDALLACPLVHTVVVFKRTGATLPWHPSRDVSYRELVDRQRATCAAEVMDAEDPLFLLYTSGSTGKPKGLLHTSGGYLVHAALSHRTIFDLRPGDVYACMADIGWITGHSYIVYGPLCNGATTFMFEGTPTHPDPARYWRMVERHRFTQFYTAPTALRALMKHGDQPVRQHDRSSLRVLGSVGEPINPEAWRWYYHVVGDGRCTLVDTYWQTETGAILFSSLPGATAMKPGSAGVPFYGVRPAVGDPETGRELTERDELGQRQGVLLVKGSWPGQARTILDDHQRFVSTYYEPFPGCFFTGDGCTFDQDDFLWISGRVDDVINKAGHRLGTAEIEGALTLHTDCSEAAVIGVPDPVKGQAIVAFCVMRPAALAQHDQACENLRHEVRQHIGGLAVPDVIVTVSGLPKTRSGKIMRRILKKIATNQAHNLGDTSTLADPEILDEVIQAFSSQN